MGVTVEYGPNDEVLNLNGKTVADAVAAARLHWILPETVSVRLNGSDTSDLTTRLFDGDYVEIIKPSGDKGC